MVAAEAERSPAGLRGVVAEVLGVDLRGGGDARLVAALAARGPMLLFLDNLEQVEEPGPLLVGWLQAAPELRILVTSRHRLQVRPERAFELDALADADARQLFQLRSGETADDPEALSELLDRVDRIPLAIELLAAQRLLMPVDLLRTSVDEELRDLPHLHVDVPARHQSLRATLDWSWSLLDPADREVLEALGVFAGPFTTGRALAVVGRQAVRSLHTLRSASLLQLQPDGHLRLQVPVRAHAREKLLARSEADAVYRALGQDLARSTRSFRTGSLQSLAALRGDLWTLIERPLDPLLDPADMLTCAATLAWLDGYRRDHDGLAPLYARLTELAELDDPAVAGRALAEHARLASNHHRAEAATLIERARERSPEDGEVLLVAATIAGRVGQHREAVALAEAAEAAFERENDRVGAALAKSNRATTLVRSGQDALAADILESSVDALHQLGAHASATPFAINLVVALGNLGRIQERGTWLDRLDRQLDADPDPYARAIVDFEWGRHLAGQGSLRRAAELLERAQCTMRDGGAPQWYCAWALAITRGRLGQHRVARRLIDDHRAEARAAGPIALADFLRAACIVAHLAGDDTTALAEAQASIELYAQHDQGAGVAELSAWAALTLLRLGRPEEVSQLPWPDPVVGSATLVSLAELLRATGRGDGSFVAAVAALEARAADEDVLLVRGLAALVAG